MSKRGAGLGLMLCAAGCAELDVEPEYGARVEQGTYVEIWASAGEQVCAGNLGYLDAFVERLRAEVGPHPGAEESRRYYVLDEEDWARFDAQVGCRGFGCTTASRTIYTRGLIPSPHEMVHAELFADGHRFLEEGLAVVYGEPGSVFSPTDYHVVDGLSETWVAPEAYARAGHFTSYLLDEYGVDAFLSAKDASAFESSYDDLSNIFENEVGAPLGTVLDGYASHQPLDEHCDTPGYHRLLVECAQPPLPWTLGPTTASISLEHGFACADEDVMGPYGDMLFIHRTVRLEQARQVLLRVERPARFAELLRCDGRCGDDDPGQGELTASAWPDRPADVHLGPGTYVLRVFKPVQGGSDPVRVQVLRDRESP